MCKYENKTFAHFINLMEFAKAAQQLYFPTFFHQTAVSVAVWVIVIIIFFFAMRCMLLFKHRDYKNLFSD